MVDHKSRNGTSLNDKPVETAPLQFGDVIGIGDLKLAFDCAANVAAAEASDAFHAFSTWVQRALPEASQSASRAGTDLLALLLRRGH